MIRNFSTCLISRNRVYIIAQMPNVSLVKTNILASPHFVSIVQWQNSNQIQSNFMMTIDWILGEHNSQTNLCRVKLPGWGHSQIKRSRTRWTLSWTKSNPAFWQHCPPIMEHKVNIIMNLNIHILQAVGVRGCLHLFKSGRDLTNIGRHNSPPTLQGWCKIPPLY